jgi:hypothetical protein
MVTEDEIADIASTPTLSLQLNNFETDSPDQCTDTGGTGLGAYLSGWSGRDHSFQSVVVFRSLIAHATLIGLRWKRSSFEANVTLTTCVLDRNR